MDFINSILSQDGIRGAFILSLIGAVVWLAKSYTDIRNELKQEVDNHIKDIKELSGTITPALTESKGFMERILDELQRSRRDK